MLLIFHCSVIGAVKIEVFDRPFAQALILSFSSFGDFVVTFEQLDTISA